jgi:hypothetical protein
MAYYGILMGIIMIYMGYINYIWLIYGLYYYGIYGIYIYSQIKIQIGYIWGII